MDDWISQQPDGSWQFPDHKIWCGAAITGHVSIFLDDKCVRCDVAFDPSVEHIDPVMSEDLDSVVQACKVRRNECQATLKSN